MILSEKVLRQKSIEAAKKSADSMSTVLIQGPSGTGKELYARAIHNESKRRHGPLWPLIVLLFQRVSLKVNCLVMWKGPLPGLLKGKAR